MESYCLFIESIGAVGAKNMASKFETIAKSGEDEARKRADEERSRRVAREKMESEKSERAEKERLERLAQQEPPVRERELAPVLMLCVGFAHFL